jgi:hypothetical protein
MHKEELLDLHEHMVTVKEYLQGTDDVPDDAFAEYEELDLDPSQVHKSKSEHKYAVFVLGNAMAQTLSEDEFSNAGRIGKRMQELADDVEADL